ncbi:MAG: phosphate ABC transporter substrate-binding protein PstS, partial [Chloroflexaceae bacterium]|nr:phosphate ABC transporter substrate-binding protein PstS [Chloroflexaceae bacterium]
VYKQYPDAAKADAVKKLVGWILSSGQNINPQLEFTRIPAPVAQRAIQTVNSSVTASR